MKQISEMGFSVEACRKAVHFTGNQGSDLAINWVMEHMTDADFNEPLVIKGAKSGKQLCRSVLRGDLCSLNLFMQ